MTDKKSNEPLKVTDKRIFTPDGDIREEFQNAIQPSNASEARPAPAPEPEPQREPDRREPQREEPREPKGERGANPGTPFSNFVESLVVQAYMSLGMLRSPYGDVPVDPKAARQMIEMLTMLKEKTEGNLTVDEQDFLDTHLGELKLAWVRQNKSL